MKNVHSHHLFHLLRRAILGVRNRPWLHLLSFVTLCAAFLSFCATLTAAANLDSLLSRWVGSAEMTVYLKDNVDSQKFTVLSAAISKIEGVERVDQVPPEVARDRFANDLGNSIGDMARTLPTDAFPGSLDVHLQGSISHDQKARRALASRISSVEMVEEVELYDDWFERLSALTLIGRIAAWGLGFLAMVVAVLVVTAVVRSGVTARAKEIKVLKLVGATDRYIRFPFLLEGATQAAVAMLAAIGAMNLISNYVGEVAGDLMPLLSVGNFISLAPITLVLLMIGSAMTGIVGAGISLRGLES